jgi:hypothetical protein
MVHTRLNHFCGKPAHSHHCTTSVLVALHTLIDVMCYYTPSVHSDAYYIPELLLVGCLAPVCLRLASCQDIGVEFAAQLIQGVDLHSGCKNPKAIKIFHYNANAVIWFGTGSRSICCLSQKSSTWQVIWFLAADSCWAIWNAVSASWEFFARIRLVRTFSCIPAISSDADGRVLLMKSLVPVSNCFD